MQKLPVGRIVRLAYAFTFGEIGTIIGLVWIPALITAVGGFFAMGGYGFYVWGAYGVTALAIAAELLALRARRRAAAAANREAPAP